METTTMRSCSYAAVIPRVGIEVANLPIKYGGAGLRSPVRLPHHENSVSRSFYASGKVVVMRRYLERRAQSCSRRVKVVVRVQNETKGESAIEEKVEKVGKEDEEESKEDEEAKSVEAKDKELENLKPVEPTDWRLNEDYRKFLANPSIEAALKVEKKRTEERLAKLDQDYKDQGFIQKLLSKAARSVAMREIERLDRAESQFKALDLSKLKSCFSYDTFFSTEVRRFGDGALFVGNLRRPIEEVRPVLEKRLAEAAGREVDVWFMEEKGSDSTPKQVVVVQPKDEIDLQLEAGKLSNWTGYAAALLFGIATLGTVAIVSGVFLGPDATFDDFIARVVPLFTGFVTIFGVSEVATRLTAKRYGVTLGPTVLIPSNWTGCLGAINNYETLLPSKRALFDIPATRVASSFATSALLTLIAFFLDGDFAGGSNALFIRPQFFINNPLLSFVQYVIGPYNDELGNVLPQAVEGLGVPLDPLALAGLLGIVVTALNLLPAGRLEGGRIAQALLGRRAASILSAITTVGLGIGGISGSILCLTWAFIVTFFRSGEELPAQDEITPLGQERYVLGAFLAVICILALFPNSAGTFPSTFYTPPFWRGSDYY